MRLVWHSHCTVWIWMGPNESCSQMFFSSVMLLVVMYWFLQRCVSASRLLLPHQFRQQQWQHSAISPLCFCHQVEFGHQSGGSTASLWHSHITVDSSAALFVLSNVSLSALRTFINDFSNFPPAKNKISYILPQRPSKLLLPLGLCKEKVCM